MEFLPIYCITISIAIVLSVWLLAFAQYVGWLTDIKKAALLAAAVTLLAVAACPPLTQLPLWWLAAAALGGAMLFRRLALRLAVAPPVFAEEPIEFEEITQCNE